MLLGYLYFRLAGEAYALVAIGLISFAAVAQFAPAVIGGHLLERARPAPARSPGSRAGFAVWLYTLLLPSFAKSGWLPASFLDRGPARHRAAQALRAVRARRAERHHARDAVEHARQHRRLRRSCRVVTTQSVAEQAQAARFVDVYRHASSAAGRARVERHGVACPISRALLARFLGPERARRRARATMRGAAATPIADELPADAALVQFAETALAGAIGGASARIMVASVVKEDALSVDEVMAMLDEASQVDRLQPRARAEVARARWPPRPSCAPRTSGCSELDRMKDDFVSTVTHELRTPLTSIRAFSEILHDNPGARRRRSGSASSTIIIQESERLTRLINQVLDLAKLESGRAEWQARDVDLRAVIEDSVDGHRPALPRARTSPSRLGCRRACRQCAPTATAWCRCCINLLSNAAKFVEAGDGRVVGRARAATRASVCASTCADNGPGDRRGGPARSSSRSSARPAIR